MGTTVRLHAAQASPPDAMLDATLELEMMGVPPSLSAISDPEGKRCRRCKRWLPLTSYPADRNRKDGHRETCNHCRNAQIRVYRQDDDRPPSPKERVAYAIRTWNGMSPSRKRMQREACERHGHHWMTSDFSERMQVCLACCAYQETP